MSTSLSSPGNVRRGIFAGKPKGDITNGNNFFVPKLRGIVQNVGESHHMPTGVAAVRERKFDSGGCDNVCSQGGCVNVDWARIIVLQILEVVRNGTPVGNVAS